MRLLALAVGLVLGLAARASAQQSCLLDRTSYPENAVVCSSGFVIYCSNGVWQNNNGARCDTPSGSYLTPLRPYQAQSSEPIPEYLLQKYPGLLTR
ncbi:MAG TPA: hypothetical protein VFD92_12955 [Candidatus Binatia bacterium]|nr:hypothetical protein [Candidatus Binatia bacterium]